MIRKEVQDFCPKRAVLSLESGRGRKLYRYRTGKDGQYPPLAAGGRERTAAAGTGRCG